MTEQELQKQIIEYLTYKKIFCWRNNSGAVVSTYKGKKRLIRYGLKGSADIFCVLPDGRFFCVEVKLKKNKPTVDQLVFLAAVTKNNGVAAVAYCLEDVETALKRTAVGLK